jgi:hypothetical protein
MLGRILWGSGKLAAKYVLLPIAVTLATALVADAMADRIRARTHKVRAHQAHLDVGIDPALHPAP